MYRIQILSWNKRYHYLYYRCTGSGPQRKGCGNMVDYLALNAIVAMRIFMTSKEPHKERRWVVGENCDAQISEVMQDIRELANDPLAEGFHEQMATKTNELADLMETNKHHKRGHCEDEIVRHPDGSVMTVGEHFLRLDRDGQREYLKTRDIRAEKADPGESGETHAIRLVIDGGTPTCILTRRRPQQGRGALEHRRLSTQGLRSLAERLEGRGSGKGAVS
jgi:hypothetical protein